METQHVTEEDFHKFRVLGVGGFGAVHAAVKKDTGILLAIKVRINYSFIHSFALPMRSLRHLLLSSLSP